MFYFRISECPYCLECSELGCGGVTVHDVNFYIRASQVSQKTKPEIPGLWRLRQVDDRFQTMPYFLKQ